MLYDVCLYLKNWFNFNQPRYFGKFEIKNGNLTSLNDGEILVENQYYRIVGSVFNDGVYKHCDESEKLTDETFDGAVWMMAIPPDFLALIADIETWQAKYGNADSANMSPFQSESFGGYSYSKGSTGSSSVSNASVSTWQAVFADRLARYRKI